MFSRFFKRLAILFRRDRFRSELDEEMAFHRAQAEKELVASGMSPENARYAAMRRFGNSAQLRGRSSEAVSFHFETVAQDLRFSLRQLSRNPGFAVTAVSILALGIASSVAIFAFVDAALIKPLPFEKPARLVQLFESIPLGPRFHLSYPDYLDWKHDNKVFSALNVFEPFGFMLKTGDGLRQADGARVSDGFFRTLGVTPILGRDFYYGEDKPEAPRVTLLSYSAWERRYGGSPSAIGQTVVLDGDSYTIIGVLPREFSFAPAEPADFWAILKPQTCRGCHGLFGIARLKDGVTFAAAFADIRTIAQNLEKQYPDSNRDQWAFMLPLVDVIVGDIRPILLVLLCGAGLLLVIAAINVCSLLLVRAESRRREMAVRGALGASPRRLVRQFVTEAFTLAIAGGVLGIAAAQASMRALATLVPKDIMAGMPYLQGIGLNLRIMAFAVLLIVLAGALFALAPLARMRFTDIRDGLAEGARGAAGVVWRRFGANLVVVELAMAVVLLAAAGLLGKSLFRLLHADIGLEPDHIATIRVQGRGESYSKDEQCVALGREIVRRIGGLPGVGSVALTNKLPLEDGDWTSDIRFTGRPYHGEHWEVAVRSVSSEYMPTLKTRLLSGRYFDDDEDQSKPRVVIVNQALVKQYYAGQNPVGTHISFDGTDKTQMLVIGVIADIQESQLDAGPRAAIYRPFNQAPDNGFVVIARTAQDERALLPEMASMLHSIDPGLAVFDPMTLDQKIHDGPSTYLHRSSAWLVSGFAAMALLLGAVGLYGAISYSVSQRTREIGVRMALGAGRANVSRMVMSEAGRLIVLGILGGLAAALPAALLMRRLLFGVRAWDVPTFIGVAAVLACVTLLASYMPARRAASLSPAEALRAE